MSRGLDEPVDSLDPKLLKYTAREFQGKRFRLMTRKGVYPYDYIMDSFSKFEKQSSPTGRASIAYSKKSTYPWITDMRKMFGIPSD